MGVVWVEMTIDCSCQSLQSAVSSVRGLFSFTSGRIHDAKRQLRETLAIANASDLNKLTSCSLLLLGQIFMALGNNKVCWYPDNHCPWCVHTTAII